MIQTFINPLLIVFTLSTTLGVLVHDTHLDRAATIAITVPFALATYAAVDIKSDGGHTHVERMSGPKLNALRAAVPRIQPRDDNRNYLLNKAGYAGGLDTTRLWPSV
jgi:hypothetical protein